MQSSAGSKCETLFTLKIDTGILVPGTKAIFFCPTIPGPEIKNAKASLYSQTKLGSYSSELNTYENLILSPRGMKSNSRIQASRMLDVGTPIAAARLASPGKNQP